MRCIAVRALPPGGFWAETFHAIISSKVQYDLCEFKTYINNSPYLEFLLQLEFGVCP